MRLLFFGDSITDAGRNRDDACKSNIKYGGGYVMQAMGRLLERDPVKYEIINRGISGNRVVDLYARIKCDVWNHNPDVVTILVGVNDVWHELYHQNGVDIERYERVYRMIIEDTQKVLPNAKIMLCEPFVLHGINTDEKYEEILAVLDYARVVKKLAGEYGLYFVPLQKKFTEADEKYGGGIFLRDGVHPTVAGSALLANEWLKVFERVEVDLNR